MTKAKKDNVIRFTDPGENFQYYRVPRLLIDEKIVSFDAAMLFSILLSRYKLSQKNGPHWRTEDGQVYIIFKNEDICRIANCKHDKATKLLNELEKAGLIFRKRQGRGLPTRIFVLAFCAPKNPHSTLPKNGTLEIGKTDASYTNNRNINIYKKDTHETMVNEYFENIWNAYPEYHRGNRQQALEVFRTQITSAEDADCALSSLKLWKQSEKWSKNGGQYIPYLHNWLERRLWMTKPASMTTPCGISGELGNAELEAIRRILSKDANQ